MTGIIACYNELPDEILLSIASHLDRRSLGRLSQVSKRCKAIANDTTIWKAVAQKLGINDFHGEHPKVAVKQYTLDNTKPSWSSKIVQGLFVFAAATASPVLADQFQALHPLVTDAILAAVSTTGRNFSTGYQIRRL